MWSPVEKFYQTIESCLTPANSLQKSLADIMSFIQHKNQTTFDLHDKFKPHRRWLLNTARHTVYPCTGGNRTKLPSSRWRRRGRSLREVFACSCFFATTDLSQIYNRETRRHGTPCTKTTDSYLFSFLYNDPRKIRRETTVGKFVPNNGRR